MPTMVPRNMIYNTVKSNKTHLYIIEIYIDYVPVSFSFLGFDICAQKYLWVTISLKKNDSPALVKLNFLKLVGVLY